MIDEDFLEALKKTPKDEFFQNVYADWLEETSQDKYRILRSWLMLQTTAVRFAELYDRNQLTQQDYEELARVQQDYCRSFTDNPCAEWLDDMAVARDWIDEKLAIQLGRLYVWQHKQYLRLHEKSIVKYGPAWRIECHHWVEHPSGDKPNFSCNVYIDSDYGNMVDDEEHGSSILALRYLRYDLSKTIPR